MKSGMEINMNVNIGDKVKIEATIVDYNEGAKTVKIRIEGYRKMVIHQQKGIFV